MAKIEAVKIDVRDAFLHLHETGLDGFERWLQEQKSAAIRLNKSVIFTYESTRGTDEVTGYITQHPEIREMRLPDGRNVMHLLAQTDINTSYILLELGSQYPELLSQKDSSDLKLTPAFHLFSMGGSQLVYDMLCAAFGDDKEQAKAILSQKDDDGNGLSFYCAAHAGIPGLKLLKHYGIDIFDGLDKNGAASGQKPNIIGAGCAKFRQLSPQDRRDGTKAYDDFFSILAMFYVRRFDSDTNKGIDRLRALVSSDVQLYAPMLGGCFKQHGMLARMVPETVVDCHLFDASEIRELLQKLSPKAASEAAQVVIDAADSKYRAELKDALDSTISAADAKTASKHEVRLGHYGALDKLVLTEKERVTRMLTHPLPRLADGYMDSEDFASLIQNYERFMPVGMEHGGHWLSAMGIKDNSPIPGRIFALESFDQKTPEEGKSRMRILSGALGDLHKLDCAAVAYSHPTRTEGAKEIRQYGLFLPYMKLSMDGKTVQRDLEGEAVFMAYLQEKGLVTQKDIDSAYETSTFRDKIKSDSVKLRAGWAAGH